MAVRSKLKTFFRVMECFVRQPRLSLKLVSQLPLQRRAFNYSENWKPDDSGPAAPLISVEESTIESNPLRAFFEARQTGRGIWKWNHYFDIYHRHFSKFVGREANVLEIGIYSGGSLEMWRSYFGPKCHVYGIDIEDTCSVYKNDHTSVFIGDQANRSFWKSFKQKVPFIDILVDDGGHKTEQQIVTLEEMLPHLRPGGVFVCEDVEGEYNNFSAYMHGLVNNLNADRRQSDRVDTTGFQSWIGSIHFYSFVTVIEKAHRPVRYLIAPKHGTEWQPFFEKNIAPK